MLVEYDDFTSYLLARKWILPESIVEGKFSITAISRRNNNLKVTGGASNYFLKHEIRATKLNPRQPGTVAYEAMVYDFIHSIEGKAFNDLPKLHDFDAEENLLILEAATNYHSLTEVHFEKRSFTGKLAEALACSVSRLHALVKNDKINDVPVEKTGEVPWAFSLHQPDSWHYFNSSMATIDFTRTLQGSEELCAQLSALKEQWQPLHFIHGDLKWDNILVHKDFPLSAEKQFVIVDWEFAKIGDCCWDVGTIFSQYLQFWIASIPITDPAMPDRFADQANYQLEKVQRFMRAFWKKYSQEMQLTSSQSKEWLQRSVCFSAVRLLQSAFEQLQGQASLDAAVISLMQVCSNILSRPVEAAVQLFGFPLSFVNSEEATLLY